ncbi:glycosyltransferase family 4 protein [Streptomyces sp. NPDC005571]|uniref:glycosyltransferase family 4 protein n=1 Tax=Streptomyces sp. NPDC005571 TaxID=3156888 RepID=UPI0033A557ED
MRADTAPRSFTRSSSTEQAAFSDQSAALRIPHERHTAGVISRQVRNVVLVGNQLAWQAPTFEEPNGGTASQNETRTADYRCTRPYSETPGRASGQPPLYCHPRIAVSRGPTAGGEDFMRQKKVNEAGPFELCPATARAEEGSTSTRQTDSALHTASRGLRIVLVAYACDPTRGSEPAVGWGWAEALARLGHTVEVLTYAGNAQHIMHRVEEMGPAGKRIKPHAIPVPPIPSWIPMLPDWLSGMVTEFLRYDGWQRRALTYARSQGLDGADLVHHVSYGSLQGGCALQRLGPPLVFGPVGGGQTAPHSHRRYLGDAYFQEALRSLRIRCLGHLPLCRATLREAAAVLVTNRDTERAARRLGRTDTSLMLADGIHESLLRESAEDEWARPARPPTVLWVGSLTAIKAPELALRTIAHLRSETPDVRLVILGDGPLRHALEKLALDLGVNESVEFRGRLPWNQVFTVYDNADAFLMTSLRDSSSMQSLEACARGVPVVHLGHHGIGDFSAPGGAVSVPLGSPADLPQRLASALNGVLSDEQARRCMGRAALAWARKHTWAAKAEIAEKLYHTILPTDRPSATALPVGRPELGGAAVPVPSMLN